MESELIFRIIGAIGLVFITTGVLTKKRINQNIYFIVGGSILSIYSIYLGDPIFIPLQIIFVIAAIYELHKLKKKKS